AVRDVLLRYETLFFPFAICHLPFEIPSFMPHLIHIGKLTLGEGHPLFLIAGPCVIESERHTLRVAERLTAVTRTLKIPFIFKASYDKANRTSLASYRGRGLQRGLQILARVRRGVGVRVVAGVEGVCAG